jgi:uncharacterized protein HemY
MLAAVPSLAQIVPENKGYVLGVENSDNFNLYIIYFSLGIFILLVLVIVYLRKIRNRRRYRSR